MAADVAVVGGAVTVDCVVTGMVVKTVPPVVVSVSSEGIVIWNWLVSSYQQGSSKCSHHFSDRDARCTRWLGS